MIAVLALQVDPDEQIPIGVFKSVIDAQDRIIAEERERGAGDDEIAEFRMNLSTEYDVETQLAPRFDIQFESGFGSWDIRLVSVDVHL